MQKTKIRIVIGVGIALMLCAFGVAKAAPSFVYQVSILPNLNDTFDLGTTTLEWNNLYVKNIHCTGTGCGGGGGGATTTPGGLNLQVQYNNAGVFGGISGAVTNGTILNLTNPLIGGGTLTTSSVNGVTLTAAGSATSFLNGSGAYSVPAGTGITALTGDVSASGSGSVAATLATVNSNVGAFTCANLTANGKGLITAVSNGSCSGGGGGTSPFTQTGANIQNVSSSTALGINISPGATLDVSGIGGVMPFRVASSSGTSLFEVEQNGNVGISSSSANFKLSVNGNAYIGEAGLPGGSLGSVLNTYTTDLNSLILSNSFQAAGSLNAAGSYQMLQFNATDSGGNAVNTIQGINGLAIKSTSGSIATLIAIQGSPRLTGTATATTMEGYRSQIRTPAGTAASTTIDFSATAATSGGVVTNAYGVRVAAKKVTGVVTGYGIGTDGATDLNYFMGATGIGTTSPLAKLDVYGAAGASPFRVSSSTNTALFEINQAGAELHNNLAGSVGQLLTSQGSTAAPVWTSTSSLGLPTSVASADGSITVTNPTAVIDLAVVKAPKWSTARLLAGNSVDGSANVAFANKFIAQGTSDAGLSGAQFLGSLATGIVKNTTTTGVLSIATAGTDYEVPLTFSTGLTRTTNTVTVNTSQNISTLSNLTSNGLVTTSGGTGTLSVTVPGTGWLTSIGSNIGASSTIFASNGTSGIWVATSTLFGAGGGYSPVGTLGQTLYFNGTNTLLATSTITVAATTNVGIGSTSPTAKLSVDAPSGTASYFTIGSSTGQVLDVAPSTAPIFRIGTTTATSTLSVAGTALITGNVNVKGINAQASGNLVVCINATSGDLFYGATAASCNTSSALTKKDIQDASSSLDELRALRPVSFYYNNGTDKSQYLGLLAEDLELIDPRTVEHKDGKPYAIRVEVLVTKIIMWLQDQDKTNTKQDQEIADLKAQVQALQTAPQSKLMRCNL